MPTSLISKFEPNSFGRDYVVGDVHGAFHLLMRALDEAGFNPKHDRLFCTGDLVDRGPYSAEVLSCLREPWVFPVRGNHEQMLLDMYADGELVDEAALAFNVAENGMGWWLDITPAQRGAILEAFARLPLVIEVATTRGRVGILHAEVPPRMPWDEFVSKIERGDEFVMHSALWGRTRAKHNHTGGVAGIDRVFVGHTPQWAGATRLGNVYLIDTGAVFGQPGEDEGRLTLSSLTCKSGILTTPRSVLTLIDLRDEPSQQPFGAYAAAGLMGLLAGR